MALGVDRMAWKDAFEDFSDDVRLFFDLYKGILHVPETSLFFAHCLGGTYFSWANLSFFAKTGMDPVGRIHSPDDLDIGLYFDSAR